MAFAPDAKHLVVTDVGADLTALDAATGKPPRPFGRHNLPAQGSRLRKSIVFSPDGKCVATGSDGFGIALGVWDFATGQPVAGVPCGTEGLMCVAFSPDNRRAGHCLQS